MRLDRYTTGDYTPGAPLWQQVLWFFVGRSLVQSYWLPFSGVKVRLLRLFGAKIGAGVRIKPGVLVKFPWRLDVGDRVWIGERVWIDNLAVVAIGDDVCLSQDVYLCTGNHDWTDPTFSLRVAEIAIESGSWIAARATVAPGVRVGAGAVLGLGSVAIASLRPMTIYLGNPARAVKPRQIADAVAGSTPADSAA